MAKNDELKEIFSKNLCDQLEKRDWEQKYLAKIINQKFSDANIKPGHISQWCSGKYLPTSQNLHYIAEALGVPENTLIDKGGDQTLDRKKLEQKFEICDKIEKCYGSGARDVVIKLLNLNDAGILAVNKYVDFLAEQPEYQIEPKKDTRSSGKKAM